MTDDFLELLKEFVAFNFHSKNQYTLKEYLIQELNYSDEDANEINITYNRIMKYS